MIIPVAALALLLLPAVLGGRLSRLAGLQLQRTSWLAAALAVQVVVIHAGSYTAPQWRPALAAAHVGSYLLAARFLWANRQIPWLWLSAIGGASNGLTIAINHGTLPARASAMRMAGLDDAAGTFTNSGTLANPRLWFLGDVFAIPAGWPLANVFSVGDLLILAGAGLGSAWICGTFWRDPWRPQQPAG